MRDAGAKPKDAVAVAKDARRRGLVKAWVKAALVKVLLVKAVIRQCRRR